MMLPSSYLSPISKVNHEDTSLLSVLTHHLGSKIKLARKKLICILILALYRVQTVNFDRLATAFNTEAQKDSSLRCIQRFFSAYLEETKMLKQNGCLLD